MNFRLPALTVLLLALSACGTRSGLLIEASSETADVGVDAADAGRDAVDGNVLMVDASGDSRVDSGCDWRPRMNGGNVADPTRVELSDVALLSRVQVVAYDDGYFFVADVFRELRESPAVVFGTFDEPDAEPVVYEPVTGSAARLAPVSRSSVFSEGERLLRLEQGRRGFRFPGPGTCTSVIHGAERAYAWLAEDGATFVWDVALSPTEPFQETIVDEHVVMRLFPEAMIGAVWDSEMERAVWLTGEVRAAVGEQALWLFDGEEPRRVVVQTGEDFVWLHGLALRGDGVAMTLNLAGPPRLLFVDIESGAILEERAIRSAYFDNAGLPTEGHFADYAGGTLANLGGVVVDFPSSDAADSRVVFDEHAGDEPGRTLAAYDIAVHGSSAVTAMVVSVGGAQHVELRHYECR